MGSGVEGWVIGQQKLVSPGKIIAWKGIKNHEAGLRGLSTSTVQLPIVQLLDLD